MDDFRIESLAPTPGVRVTHVATGLTATCDSERSSTLNMRKAMSEVEDQVLRHYGPWKENTP